MEINSPDQFMHALANLMMQMDRKQRKQFLVWVKNRRLQYDFTYPEGYKPPVIDVKGDTNVQSSNPVEPIIVVPSAPVLLVPEPGAISSTNTVPSSASDSLISETTGAV